MFVKKMATYHFIFLLFNLVSTTQRSTDNDQIIFQDQLGILKLHIEIKYLLERFEVKMTEMEKTLDKFINVHNDKLNSKDTSPQNEDIIISKIEKILEEKLKLYNIDFHNKSETKTKTEQTVEFEKKLQQIKIDVVAEIERKQIEQTKILNTNLKNMRNEITDKVISGIKTEMQLYETNVNTSGRQLEEIKKQIIVDCRNQKQQNAVSSSTANDIPKNCKEILERGNNVSKIYAIKPNLASQPFQVFCDMNTRGGGWIYVLYRFDGSQDFYLNWTDYKQGFGNLTGEFWLGLEHLYQLTGSDGSELLFELTDWEGKTVYAHFKTFSVDNEDKSYAIKVLKEYSGDAGSYFLHHQGYKFSSLDRQSDAHASCVKTYNGPWWYGAGCFYVKLTGRYLKGDISTTGDGIHWADFRGYKYSLKEVKMMIRP